MIETIENSHHISVLKNESVHYLVQPFFKLKDQRGVFLDCTLGGGGHTQAMIDALKQNSMFKAIAVDQDPEAIRRAETKFKNEINASRLELIHARMSDLGDLIKNNSIYAMLADLGYSSDQLDNPQRGISFLESGPLDMRLNPTQGRTLLEFLQTIRKEELENIIKEYGEERFFRRIASFIVRARDEGSLPKTTVELAELIKRSVPTQYRYGRIHPATRTFQALRIAINDELGELDALLNRVMILLKPGGRAAVISFHSLEDRKVKNAFKALAATGEYQILTKKPIVPSDEEINVNPRARSAKMRVIERVR